jgi:hypothetical protein
MYKNKVTVSIKASKFSRAELYPGTILSPRWLHGIHVATNWFLEIKWDMPTPYTFSEIPYLKLYEISFSKIHVKSKILI